MRYLLLFFIGFVAMSAYLNNIEALPYILVILTLSLFAFYGACMLYDRHGRPR
jgi:polyferredoxin